MPDRDLAAPMAAPGADLLQPAAETGVDAERLRRSIDDAARELLVREPYFGHLLVGTVRAVVGGDFGARLAPSGHTVRLEVGAARWAGMPAAARTAALKHELLHLTLKHPLRARAYASIELWGLACDLVVNQLFDPTDLDGALTIADFAEAGLQPNETADAYYHRLMPLYEECVRQGGDCTGGGCGGADRATAAMRRWLSGGPAAAGHEQWRAFAALASAAQSVLENNVDALVESTVRRARCRGWGPLPKNLVELLEGLVARRAEIPWRRVVRLFAATSERTWIKNTLSRPSKRYGTSPGVRVRRRTNLVVAVDTSGSVSADDIGLFFAEVHGLWRRGVEVTVLECDAAVQREYPYRGTPPRDTAGRGGTAFDPAIARANQLRPDGLVYLTDGHAPAPAVPARMPLLWVLSREGRPLDDATHLPGRRVKLTRTA